MNTRGIDKYNVINCFRCTTCYPGYYTEVKYLNFLKSQTFRPSSTAAIFSRAEKVNTAWIWVFSLASCSLLPWWNTSLDKHIKISKLFNAFVHFFLLWATVDYIWFNWFFSSSPLYSSSLVSSLFLIDVSLSFVTVDGTCNLLEVFSYFLIYFWVVTVLQRFLV